MLRSKFINRVFCGPNAAEIYCNPKHHPPTPLVELLPEDFLGELAQEGVRIFAKCEFLLPMLNVKMRQVSGLIDHANSCGRLDGVNTLDEGSSGSTGHILPLYAKGKKVEIIVSPGLAKGKLAMMRLTGASWPFKESEDGISQAREMGEQEGHLNLGQYDNYANPVAMETLAREIDEQTNGEISVLCAGMGTRATVVGAARYFQSWNDFVRVVGVLLADNQKVPGVRTTKKLQTDFGWEDQIIPVTMEREPSFFASIHLIRKAQILGGPSSGFALAGLLKFLLAKEWAGTLDDLRNKNGEIIAVFICPDPPHLYVDEYEPYLEKYEQSL